MNAFTRAGFTVLSLVTLIASCGPVPPKAKDDVVPKELVPPGYQQSKCHFEKMWYEDDQPQDRSSGISGGVMDKANSGGERRVVHPPVKCEHTVKDAVQICFDDNGVEHPMQWCLDRKAARDADETPPTSGMPPALCGDSSGVLRICEG
jgi:hypothetical protein